MSANTRSSVESLLESDQHLLLEAGAGSGKTTAIVDKLLRELGFNPASQPTEPLALSELVAITFTRKAASELRERLRKELLRRAHKATGADREYWASQAFALDHARIGTIDSFAMSLIKEHGSLLGFDSSVQILSASESNDRLNRLILSELEKAVSSGRHGAVQLVRQFGTVGSLQIIQNSLNHPERVQRTKLLIEKGQADWGTVAAKHNFTLTPSDRVLEPIARAMAEFLISTSDLIWEYLKKENILTMPFALWAAYLLSTDDTVREAFQKTTRFVAVDEHQDTSRLQAQLLFNLIGLPGSGDTIKVRSLFVGDPKQSIYAFRNADITMWTKTAKLVIESGGQVLQLPDNWRSHPQLTAFYDSFFGRVLNNGQPASKPLNRYERVYRTLKPTRDIATPTGTVEILVTKEKGTEQTAARVARQIKIMLDNPSDWPVMVRTPDGMESTRPVKPSDIAILSRELKRSGEIYAAALSAENISSTLTNSRGLYARSEVRDLIDMLTALLDPTDQLVITNYLRSPLAHLSDAQVALLAADGPIWESMQDSQDSHVQKIYQDILRYRSIINRVSPAELLRLIVSDTSYRAFVAGSPDGLAAVRSIDRFIEIAALTPGSLADFVDTAARRIMAAEREEETPLYGTAEDKINITTIHGAKGLEWPVVFVVGIDEPLMRAVDATSPQWTDLGGLVLPTEVILADGQEYPQEASTEVSQSAIWRHVRSDMTFASYAEARRLFYVACTRARDHLFLAGHIELNESGTPIKPRSLTSSWEWMHRDTTERWMRFLYPTLADKKPLVIDPSTTPPAQIKVDRNSIGVLAEPISVDSWPNITQETPRATAVFPLATPVIDKGPVRRSWTASELLQYNISPWRHYFSYRHSISQVDLALSEEERSRVITPGLRGTILHQFLRTHFLSRRDPADQPSPSQAQAMRSIILRHIPMPEPELSDAVNRLLVHVGNIEKSQINELASSANKVHQELPFLYSLDPTTQLEGVMDLAWQDSIGLWHLADFKTAQMEVFGEALSKILDQQAEEYEIQAAVYALALSGHVGEDKVSDFTFIFTDSGETRTIAITPEWLTLWRAKIMDIISAIRRNDYGPGPIYEAKICKACPFRRICKPLGDPNPYAAELKALGQAEEPCLAPAAVLV